MSSIVDEENPGARGETEASAVAGVRVLLVDDNAEVLESTQLVLEMMDFDVRTATSGTEALDLGEGFEPEVVLLDIGLPGMDGWTAAKQMRTHDWGQNALLVAVTGWGREEDLRRSREAGFDHHLLKPMDPDELLNLLGSVRGSHFSQADAA